MAVVRKVSVLLALRLALVIATRAGVPCTTTSGKTGSCKRLDQCPAMVNAIKTRTEYPSICSYEGTMPIVCCPSTLQEQNPSTIPTPTKPTSGFNYSPNTSKAKEMCKLYEQYVFERRQVPTFLVEKRFENVTTCAMDAKPLIVGGELAQPKEFPHMALVGFGEKNDISWYCGGSLISPKYVLTAGHCLLSRDKGNARWVKLGELVLGTESDDAQPQLFSISEIINHPDYQPPAHYNDIALLKLDKEVKCNGYIRPACLHVEHGIPWPKGVASGWGREETTNQEGSKELRKVSLPFQSTEKCQSSYKRISGSIRLRKGIAADSMICAGELLGNKDTCQGDSGGPLQYPDQKRCMYEIVGVTSFGKSFCGEKDSPAVYTRVSHFVPWIEGIVWPDN